MTRKDFEAAAVKLAYKRFTNVSKDTQMITIPIERVYKEIENFLVEFFCNDNPRFNEERFRKACQP